VKVVTANHTPRSLRRGGVLCDHVVLMPASFLRFRNEWRRIANALPRDEALLVVPNEGTALRASMRDVAWALRLRGIRVSAVDADQFNGKRPCA